MLNSAMRAAKFSPNFRCNDFLPNVMHETMTSSGLPHGRKFDATVIQSSGVSGDIQFEVAPAKSVIRVHCSKLHFNVCELNCVSG